MKLWSDMSHIEQRKLMAYDRALKIESPNDDDMGNMLLLKEYCLKNNLDHEEIPESGFTAVFDEHYRTLAVNMSPFTFEDLYKETRFLDSKGELVDTTAFILENNIQKELLEIFKQRKTIPQVKLNETREQRAFKEKCVYLAEENGLPPYMGELMVSEIKLGDKSCPVIINMAVNLGLVPHDLYVT